MDERIDRHQTEEPAAGMTRRQLLARTGAAAGWAAGLALAGQTGALAAFGKRGAPAPKLILGSGSHRYECIHDWLTPPPDILWGDTHGVAQDSRGRIYISHTVNPKSPKGDAIVVFDRNGKFLTSWGERFRGGGHGIDLRKENGKEVLYHSDIAHRVVVKTDLDGSVLWEKGLPEESGVYKKGAKPDPFVPTNIAFAPNGDFYIADGYGSGWIHQYSQRGDYIRTFGGTGTEDGKFHCPHGLWTDHRGSEPMLVITDRESHRLQVFTLDGKFVRSITDGMRRPCNVDFRGDEVVVPDLNSVVTILDGENKVAAQLGDGASLADLRDHPRSDFVPGKFIHPHGARYLHNSDILVVEWVPIGRVTLLKKLS